MENFLLPRDDFTNIIYFKEFLLLKERSSFAAMTDLKLVLKIKRNFSKALQ
jgi:hypothetical protein